MVITRGGGRGGTAAGASGLCPRASSAQERAGSDTRVRARSQVHSRMVILSRRTLPSQGSPCFPSTLMKKTATKEANKPDDDDDKRERERERERFSSPLLCTM